MSFDSLDLIEPLRKALDTEGYTTPTPIQAQSIPIILREKDLLGCAQTGTGKTAAFAIPILQLLHIEKAARSGKAAGPIRALILTPTRELAIQIDESLAAYGRHTSVRHGVIFGGVGQKPQTDMLRKGLDVLTATPGRLLDLINQGFVDLQHIRLFVLDEADRMLDMGFIHDVKKVIARLPAQRQSLFFSATMPPEIVKLSATILRDPQRVSVTPEATTAETVDQRVYFVDKSDKKRLLVHLLQNPEIETALVFTRTKHGANRVVKELAQSQITAEAIHGNKSQSARQQALSNFKARKTRVLVATDIAARGIDVDLLSHVINYELPNVPETYVHRIGRTGRAGADGIAFSFCEGEEKPYLRDIQKLIGLQIPVIQDHPYPAGRKLSPEEEAEEAARRAAGEARQTASEGRSGSRHSGRSGAPRAGGSRSGGSRADNPRSEEKRSGQKRKSGSSDGRNRPADGQRNAPRNEQSARPPRENENGDADRRNPQARTRPHADASGRAETANQDGRSARPRRENAAARTDAPVSRAEREASEQEKEGKRRTWLDFLRGK